MTIRSKVPNKSYRDNFDSIVWGTHDTLEMGKQDNLEMGKAPMVIHDIQPFKTTDGTVIKSRKDRERYMKERGLAHASDYSPEFFNRKAAERRQRLDGVHPDQKRDRINVLRDAYEHVRDKSRYSRG